MADILGQGQQEILHKGPQLRALSQLLKCSSFSPYFTQKASLQKSALFTVLQADLLQVRPVVRRSSSPCPKYHFMMFQTIQTIHFLKAQGQRISELIFPSVSYTNTQTQIHKDTKTHIQHMTKCQKDPACAIFLKRGLFKDIKNSISMC